jgi:hypothetical protein
MVKEKATLTKINKRHNRLNGQFKLANGFLLDVPDEVILKENYKGKVFDVWLEGNTKIVKVVLNGKLLMGQSESQKFVASQTKEQFKLLHNGAKAPYNFVSLNQSVITAESPLGQTQYYKDRHTGYLQCELVTKTPLYIRDTLDEGQIAAGVGSKDNPDFFGPGGKIRIPGSSLRGMIRNLVEVLSWGNFKNFDDKQLFYRGLADTSNLRKEYQQNMTTPTGKPKERAAYNFKAGYLGRDGLKYYILPAQEVKGNTFFQVKKRNKTEEFVVEKKIDGKYLVISGKINGKEHDWLINPPVENSCENRINIKDIDVEAYKNDDNRDERADLIKQIQKDKLVPCFYVRWFEQDKSERISFGHTGYFRLAYKKSIGDHVPENLKTDSIDIPESLFGAIRQKRAFASRVFFEDAQLVAGQKNVFEQKEYHEVLEKPKPTTFQHYLFSPLMELESCLKIG